MKLPRLDREEALLLVFSALITQAVFLILALVGSMVLEGLSTGDWFYAIVQFGWIASLADSIQALPPHQTLIAALALGVVVFLLVDLTEKRTAKNEEAQRCIIESHQGLHGELPRLPILVIVILMSITGICEELLFRYVLMGLILQLFSGLIGAIAAAVIAVIVSTTLFCFAHTGTQGNGSLLIWISLGLIFSVVFAVTNSIALVIIAHALYDILVLLALRMEMYRDPKAFFGGFIPTRTLIDAEIAKNTKNNDAKDPNTQTNE